MKRKRLIALITAVTLTAVTVPNLNWKSGSSLVAEASDFTPIDYTNPENQNLSEEDLALMHEDNWLNRLVVEHSATDYSDYGGGSKSGHTLEQLDLNDFLAVDSVQGQNVSNKTEIPKSIKFLSNLTYLNLSIGTFTELPIEIGNLTKLSTLMIYSSKITTLPDSIGNLKELKVLDLHNNTLQSLPDSVGNLTKLTTLDIHQNISLSSLPNTIGGLSKLNTLKANDCRIAELPEQFYNLTELTLLDLGNNRIKSISESISNFINLTSLNLTNNRFSGFPNICNLVKLSSLSLGNNSLNSVPNEIGNLTALSSLYLVGDNLSELPDSISKLTKLTVLDLSSNSFTDLPDSLSNLTRLSSSKTKFSGNFLTKSYSYPGKYETNFVDSEPSHRNLSKYINSLNRTITSNFTRDDVILFTKDNYSRSLPDSVKEKLVITSSNTKVVDNTGTPVGNGECDITISLPGNPEGNNAGKTSFHLKIEGMPSPVDDFITTPSKDKIENALDELDSKKDSGEDITAKKDEVINKGKEYVSNSEVPKQDKYDYIDKIIDNLADEDKKVVERTDVVETIKELPKEDRKPPIDSLVDKTQDTSGTFIQGGNQFVTKGLGITLKVGEKLDLSKAVEVTYNGVKIDDSKLSDLSLPDITTEEFNEYFDENKIAIKKGSLTSKIRLTAEYDPNENELKTPSLKAGLMKAFGLNDENVVSNPAETEPVTINIIQPVVSSGETTANGDVEVKYNLNETAQLILSSDSVTFGSNTGLAEVEQDGTLTATVKSSTTYDLDLTPKSNLVNQADSSIEIPSTKANVKIADGEFKVLPEPNATINLVSGEEKTTDLEGRKKDYSLKFKIDEIIGSKAGTYKMPVRITLTQK